MMKIILGIIILLLFSCNNSDRKNDASNGDAYLGSYEFDRGNWLSIKKAGDKGYFLNWGVNGMGNRYDYCIFKDGCFKKKGDVVLFCRTDNGNIIRYDGVVLSRKKNN